ncbi:ABC-2 type transport system permease protein, partial [Tremellales sp. Uapishka_1]
MTSSAFLPSIPIMSQELNTTATTINYTVAVFIVVIGVAPVIWSPLSGFYGRRAVYLASMPIMVVASIGVAVSTDVGQLLGTRILQGIGSSCSLAVGAGSIGDIYRPTERATAMSWFLSGTVLGPALSPVIGGLFTQYTAITWRATQYFLAGAAALSLTITFFFLPETSHGILPHDVMKREREKKFVIFWFNPLRGVLLLRWPNILAMTLTSSCIMLETYLILVPLGASSHSIRSRLTDFDPLNPSASVFKDRYSITNVALSGCFYLASGAGNLAGARIAGPWSDRIVRRYITKRGYRRPEDRLRATWIGLGLLMPLSCPKGIRYIFAAAASAFALPMSNAIGLGWTLTFGALVGWVPLLLVLATYRYGDKWREAANTRYGMTVKTADEEKVVSSGDDEESRVGSKEGGGEEEHDGDEPGQLVSPDSKEKNARRKTLSRHSSRKDLPTVDEVLRKTVSLTASVHGGG